jgi:AcrR family transcriptional regulator
MTDKTASMPKTSKTSQLSVSARTSDEPVTKGERTRTTIIDAAYQLFLRNGYHGTSMRDIARAAGIALGGIYNHFETKEDIFQAMLNERHAFMNIAPALQAARGGSDDRSPGTERKPGWLDVHRTGRV